MKQLRRRSFIMLIAGVPLWGCALFVTEDFFGKSWQGQPIDNLRRQWGAPAEVIKNADGTTEVRYEIFNGRCTYYFNTDPTGKIVGYHYRSSGWGGCKPIG